MAVDGKRRVFSLASAGMWVDLTVIALGVSWPFHEYAFYAVERQVGNEAVRRAICAAAHYSLLGVPLTLGVIGLIRFGRWAMAEDGRPCPKLRVISLVVVLVVSPVNPLAYFMRTVCICDCNVDMILHSADHKALAQACAHLVANPDQYRGVVSSNDPRLPAAIRSIRTRYQPAIIGIGPNGVNIFYGGGGFLELWGYTFRRESPDLWWLWSNPGGGKDALLVSGVRLPTREGTSAQSD